MSTVSRGDDLERRAVAALQLDGYATERARKLLTWIEGSPRTVAHDHFGVYDIIALRADRPVLLLQVTTRGELRKRERKVAEHAIRFAPDSAHVECWGFLEGHRRHGGQRFVVRRLVDGVWTDAGFIAAPPRARAVRDVEPLAEVAP